jgi:chromosome segregation ATPase
MYKWLDENYEPDEGVYDVFLQEYNHLLDRRQEIQKYADTLSAMNMLKADVETKERAYLKADYDQARLLREKALSVSENEKSVIGRINDDDIKLNVYKKSLAELRTDKELIEQAIETLKANKPGLFSKRTIKKQYKQDLFQNNNDLLVKINEERALLENISQIENEINDLQNDINKNKAELESEKRNYLAWAAFEKEKIQKDAKREHLMHAGQVGSDFLTSSPSATN